MITGADVSDVRYGVSPARYDEYVLAKDKVHFVGNFVQQSPLEPHSAVAEWNHDRGTLTLWSSAQVPHYLQKQLFRVFEMPLAKLSIGDTSKIETPGRIASAARSWAESTRSQISRWRALKQPLAG